MSGGGSSAGSGNSKLKDGSSRRIETSPSLAIALIRLCAWRAFEAL
jgi:hypothetical protein